MECSNCATGPSSASATLWTRRTFWRSRRLSLPKARPRERETIWSRIALNPALFYALPQSPQQYKQLLMVAGCERYFQIARCFRDESLRADRLPEFTQLDVEMSFVEQEDVLQLIEAMTIDVVEFMSEKELPKPFPRMTYDEAMRRYGSDKPDLRFGLELVDLAEAVEGTEFVVFRSALDNGGQVKAVRYPGGASLSRKETDDLGTFCKEFGAKGLATISVTEANPGGLKSALTKFLTETQLQAILTATKAAAGDLICIIADPKPTVVANVLSRLRAGDRPSAWAAQSKRAAIRAHHRLSTGTVERRGEPLGGGASPLHHALRRSPALLRHRSGQNPGAVLRPGLQRAGSRGPAPFESTVRTFRRVSSICSASRGRNNRSDSRTSSRRSPTVRRRTEASRRASTDC